MQLHALQEVDKNNHVLHTQQVLNVPKIVWHVSGNQLQVDLVHVNLLDVQI